MITNEILRFVLYLLAFVAIASSIVFRIANKKGMANWSYALELTAIGILIVLNLNTINLSAWSGWINLFSVLTLIGLFIVRIIWRRK